MAVVKRRFWLEFTGMLGLIAVGFGVVVGSLVGFASPLITFHLLLGFVLCLVWAVLYGIPALSRGEITLTGRKTRFGLNAVLYGLIFTGLLISINWLAHRKRYRYRWDLTEQKLNSLSQQSQDVLKSLDRPVSVTAFMESSDLGAERDLLNLFAFTSDKFKLKFIDPARKPHLIEKYGMKQGERVLLEYHIDEEISGTTRLDKISEESLINAIVKLTRGVAKQLYYVVGHGEPGLDDDQPFGTKLLAEAVRNENLQLAPIVLSQHQKIPDDAAGILLVSPKAPLLPEEKSLLIEYGKAGGRILLMHDPSFPEKSSDIREIAYAFGVAVGKDIVIDQVQRPFSGPALGAQPIVRDYTLHEITRGFSNSNVTVFNMASTVGISDLVPESEKRNYSEIIKTGSQSWAESNLGGIFDSDVPEARFNPDEDRSGPLPLAVAYEKILGSVDAPAVGDPAKEDGEQGGNQTGTKARFDRITRLVVFGDSDWILNANFRIYSNKDLFLNSVNWIAGEEGGITIRPKRRKVSLLPVSAGTYLLVLACSMLVPELILIIGLGIWWRRRSLEQ